MKRFVYWAILLLAGWNIIIFAGCKKKSPDSVSDGGTQSSLPTSRLTLGYTPNASPSSDTTVTLTPSEEGVLRRAENDLTWLAKKSPTAQALQSFYRLHGIKSHLRSDGTVVSVEPSKSPQWFAVLSSGEKLETLQAGQVTAAAVFQTGNRLMILKDSPFSQSIRAVLFAHELVHAQDAVLNNEPDSPPMSDTWLFGEFHAHSVVFHILVEMTNGGWDQVVTKADEQFSALKKSRQNNPDAFALGFTKQDSIRINKVLGPLTTTDMQFIVPQFQVDANMKMVVREAQADSNKFSFLAHGLMTKIYGEYSAGVVNRPN